MTPDDRTRTNLTRQLRGLGQDALEVTVKGPKGTTVRPMTPAGILAELDALKMANASGANVWVRAARDRDHDLVLVDLDDTGPFLLDKMAQAGHAPAVAIQTSPGSCQAWVRLGRPLPAVVRHGISRELARLYGGDPGAVDPHQSGRLCGLTNRKPEHEGKGGRDKRGKLLFPYVLLLNAPGRPARGAAELIAVGEAYAARVAAAEEIRIEIADIAPADLVATWRAEYPIQALKGRADKSAVDWSLVHQALAAGMEPGDVAAVLAEVADRKGRNGKEAVRYARTTVENALRVRAAGPAPEPSEPALPTP